MYSNRTEEEIKRDMLNNIKNTVDKTENSIVHDALSPAAIEFSNAYIQMDYIGSKIDIENLEGNELERYIYQRTGITRKLATKSTTTVIITGSEGAIIRTGDLIGTGSINFIVKETKQIDESEQVNVLVECEVEGTSGNIPANTINQFPVAIVGLTSVINSDPVTNGYDDETDDSLKQRYYERIRTPASSGNKYHYINWTKEVVGVGDARAIPLWQGDNTVKVVIIDSNKQPANEELIDKVQEYIDPGIQGLGEGQAPIGAFCTVASATSKAIDIVVTLTIDTNYSLEQIKINIENEIIDYLKSIAFKKNLVSYAHIGALILDVEGVLDYTNLTVNLGIENILIEDEEVAVLGQVIVNESIA